ncbi:MAG: 50S ribosomal protein L35 [Candidatus Vogelbacteria bacterium]|nr:50S ribosomal protein L35 [Candidatus Vogelbacteria bacterium]
MKTNKSYLKRIKVTKTGKVLSRKPGKDHFNAKASGVKQLAGKKMMNFTVKHKLLKSYLQNS